MHFLSEPPTFIFFAGKGGVGKTSLACATAIYMADQGKRILLVSTDPASNLNQIFGMPIGHTITPIVGVAGLDALEIDPQAAAKAYRDRVVHSMIGTLPDAIVKDVEERLSGACTTEIATFDKFTELLTEADLSSQYDHVVFDTAPTGHTIRLLQLPGAWSAFLEEGKGDASCLGPLSGLEKQRSQYKSAVDVLANDMLSRLVLVTRAQRSCLLEVVRTRKELIDIGLHKQFLVMNGLLPPEEAEGDAVAAAIVRREQTAIDAFPPSLRDLPIDKIPLKPFNLVGLPALRCLLSNGTFHSRQTSSPLLDIQAQPLSSLVDEIAKTGKGLIMLMGKGGVGKTTLAAAIAAELAHRGHSVHLTTTDPAAHLAETMHSSLEHLTVSRIDPRTEIERYKQHILETKGKNLDEQGRALLQEDLRSPCTEEIAVFQAFSQRIQEAKDKFVVIDTAPTGHTMLLIDATGAYHREISRQLAPGVRFTTPLMDLQNPNKTKVLIVTLAETTPVLEAANMQEDLQRAGIEPWAWIINNSLIHTQISSPLLKQRVRNEIDQINTVAKQYATRLAVVQQQPEEPVGIELLLKLTGP
jgi:arsenite-transporting ATPase